MTLSIDSIGALFAGPGRAQYGGEAVSQREHALQAAWMASRDGASDALVLACLLHDLGHLLFDRHDHLLESGIDDCHEKRILPLLQSLFPAAVWGPVGLHVQAKRYLCHVDPHYLAELSPASRASLVLQGGTMDAAEAQRFIALPHAHDALCLRHYDDCAKIVNLDVPDFAHYLPLFAALTKATHQ
jgi:phosphonate degradation associated HDIG domain protein